MIRLYVRADLAPGTTLTPTPEQARYLTGVMRLFLGSELLLFNGRDGEWRATIAEVLKRGIVLRAEEQVRPQAFGPDLELIVALVKKSRVETIVEKAAELGVRRVRPTLTRRTNVEKVRLDRLDAITEEAAEQTGRLDVPAVDDPARLDAILDGWDPARRLMFCDETGGAPAFAALTAAGPGPWAILIGPEGGFAPEERERLLGLPFTTAVSLGPRILRADTAAIAALTLWQAALGDWDR
ncbi:16S rRNA (uracil(1498)-N(3))-methyltransferase [Brevundimonas sp.]|uniref:16S rRNA (uracil(1498)-N(3))-methyltransferase n=1 Tax=Brevundimonas sp. TaxID=1871086 RepID=UPI0024897385|nr:16S rRNA (uracil(1498)-N(3))-methyltransferase [Brevundimonas sp.]MDI1280574.1 16S rRNA (uracil(1498)-N(3))-methyltransferase [Brevundimonas sp.]